MLLSINEKEEELICNKCHTTMSLKRDNVYGICKCRNVRLVYCKNQIHITVFSVKRDHWYTYKR